MQSGPPGVDLVMVSCGGMYIVDREHLRPSFVAEQIMAMPAVHARRWTAAEMRQLIADNPDLTPRYELVNGSRS